MVYDYTDSKGKRKYQSFTADTKKEAEYMAANYNLNKKQMSDTQNITLYEAYTRYIDSKSNIFSPSTLREYLNAQKRDLQGLMQIKLSNITQEMIQKEINKEALSHSPKTVRNMHGLLAAVLHSYLPSLRLNTQLPQKINPQVSVPIENEVKQLLESCKGTELYKAILLASVGALRRSEICALNRTSDILPNGVMVTKALVKDKNKQWVLKTTKTTAGQRFVPLPQEIISILSEENGDHRVVKLYPGSITNSFRQLSQKTLNKQFKFHSLRHYSASVLHSLGIPDQYIMERGGWASRETLQKIYTHAMTDVSEENNNIILNHFKNFGA